MPERMRIMLAGPYPKEDGKIHGGVEAVLFSLAEGLATIGGQEVHVLTSVPGLPAAKESTTWSGVRIHRVPHFGKLGCLTSFAVDSHRLRKVLNQVSPDVVNVHTQTMYPDALLERGFASVLTIHGVYFREVQLLRGFVQRFQGRLGCIYERNAVARAKHIVLTSRYLQDVYGDMLRGSVLHQIDNAVDDSFFNLPNLEQPEAVLYAGVILERKGVIHLVRAAHLLRDRGVPIKLWVVGPVIEPEYAAMIKAYVEDNGLRDCVEITGMIPQEELMERYSRCSMLVLPSMIETTPMAIAQAQAAGKPVVATDRAGIPCMVFDGENGYTVPYGDAEMLADRIGKLILDADTRHRMGEAARKTADSRYSWPVVVGKMLEVYSAAASRGRSA